MKKIVSNMATVVKIRVLCLLALALVVGVNNDAWAATYTVAQSGPWSEGTTWMGGGVPAASDITEIVVPDEYTLTVNVDVNLSKNVTLLGAIDIAEGKTLTLSGEKIYFANADESKTAHISGLGTLKFSHSGKTYINNLKNCFECSNYEFSAATQMIYESNCDHILSGNYWKLEARATEVFLCGSVEVADAYWNKSGIIFNGDEGTTITFNFINSDSDRALTFNINAQITNSNNYNNRISAITVNEGRKLTFLGNTNINANNLKLLGNIEIAANSTLNLGGAKIYFANDDFSKTANITGTNAENSVVNFTNNTTIYSLRDYVGCKATFAGDKSIAYDANCTRVLAGTYNNLTTDNSGTLTLCGNVIVDGTYNKKKNIVIKGKTGNETITFNGPITTSNTSLALLVNAFANGTNTFSVSRLNIGKNKTFTINGATTINTAVNLDSTGTINVGSSATLTFSNSATFNANTTITGTGNVYFNAYVKGERTKLSTYPTVTMVDAENNMNIDTIEVKGGIFNYNRSNNNKNQRPIRSLIVDGGTFVLNIPDWEIMNLNGTAILKSGTLQIPTGKTLKLPNTACDTLKVIGTATIEGPGTIGAVVAVYGTGNLTIGEDVTIRNLVTVEDGAQINIADDKTLTLNNSLAINGNTTLTGEGTNALLYFSAGNTIDVKGGKELTIRGTITNANDPITLGGAYNLAASSYFYINSSNVNFTTTSDIAGSGTISFTSTTLAINSLTSCFSGDNVELANGSTITYAETSTRIIPYIYENLILNTAVGKNITLCGNVEVKDQLTWNNGRIVLNGYELTLNEEPNIGSDGRTHMVLTDNNGKLTYNLHHSENGDNVTFYVGSYNSLSKTYMYAPVDISGINADGDYYVSVSTIGSAVSGLNTDLKRYWEIETNGTLGEEGTLTLHYDEADDNLNYGTTTNAEGNGYWCAYNGSHRITTIVSPYAGRKITIGTEDINAIDGLVDNDINGVWTAAEYPKVATLYSLYTGNWDNPDIWTTDPTGKTHVNPSHAFPNKSYDAVILSPFTIRKPSDESIPMEARAVQICKGATLDIANRTPDFNNVYGEGTLKIDGDFPPTGDYDAFMAADGGTTEFYGDHPSDFITHYKYNNLIFNYSNDHEAKFKTDSLLLNINGNLELKKGSISFTANQQAIHVGGNLEVEENGGIYIYSGGGNHTDTLQVGGNLINYGTIKLTHREYNYYGHYEAINDEGDDGRGIIRFVNEGAARFECYSDTRLSQLICDKGTDHNSTLTVFSDEYEHFALLGKAKGPKDFTVTDNPPTMSKPLWLRYGTVELTGKIFIKALSEGRRYGKEGAEDREEFFIPAGGGLFINGKDVIVHETTLFNEKVPYSGFASMGYFRIDDGTFDLGGSSGISFRGSAIMEINGGYVRCSHFLPHKAVKTGVVTYTQTGGRLVVDGVGELSRGIPAFYMPFASNKFVMTGGVIEVQFSVNKGSGGNSNESAVGGAFVVNCDRRTSSITGGEIIVNAGVTICDPAIYSQPDFILACAVPLWNLTLKNERCNYELQPSAWVYEKHKLSDYEGKVNGATVDFKCATEIQNNLTIGENVVFDAEGKTLTVGGNLIIENNATFHTGDNEIVFNGQRLQTLTDRGTVTSTAGDGFYSLTVNNGTQLKPLQNISLHGTLTLDEGSELVDGSSNIVYTLYGNADVSGTYSPSAYNGAILFAGDANQQILGSGNGLLNNVSINKTGGTLQLTAPRVSLTGNLRLLSNTHFDIGNNNLYLTNTANIYTDAYTGTAFNANRMITTSGSASAEGVTRQYSNTQNNLLFPVGAKLKVGGAENFYYTPAQIGYMEATTYGTVTTRVVKGAHPFSDANYSLQCYWVTDEQGFAGISNASQRYWYADNGLIPGTPGDYVPARYHGATWYQTSTSVDYAGRFFDYNEAESASGYYTCGDNNQSVFEEITHLYSSSFTGTEGGTHNNWDDPLSWTTTKVGDTPIFTENGVTYKYNGSEFQEYDSEAETFVVDGDTKTLEEVVTAEYLLPKAATSVTIGSNEYNHAIVMTDDGQGCASLTLAEGSTLDLGTTTDHNFALVDIETYGAGRLVIGSSNFPGGDFVKFLGANGGTVEYKNNSGASIVPEIVSESGLNISHYCNLVISGDSPVQFPAADILVYNNLTVNGQAQIVNSTVQTITINGDLNIESGQMLLNCTASQAFVVGGDVTVNAGAEFITGGDSPDYLDHTMQIGGSLNTNGQFVQFSNKKNRILLTFVGTNTAYITGSAKISVQIITCDKGTDMSAYLIINNEKMSSASDSELLKLKNGTCQIDIGSGNEIILSSKRSVTIESNARLSIKSGTAIVGDNDYNVSNKTTDFGILLNGALEVLGGKLYVGRKTPTRYNCVKYSSAGLPTITVKGGQLIVNGAIRRQDGQRLGSLIYKQTGGDVIVMGKNRASEHNGTTNNLNLALFEVLSTGEFAMTGGTLSVYGVDAENGESGTDAGDIFICASKATNTGGQIIVGDGSTTTNQKLITNISLNNLTINPKATLGVYTFPIEVKDVTIQNNGNLLLLGHTLTIKHGFYNYNVSAELGSETDGFVVGSFNHTTYFTGNNMQIGGTSGNVTNFANLQITGTLRLLENTNIQVSKKLTLTSGTVTDGGNIINLIGDIENDGKFVSNTEIGGLKFCGEGAIQYVRGRGFGEFGTVIVANPQRVVLNTDVTINKKLTLGGLLYINTSRLTLGKDAIVEAAGSSSLDASHMLLLNGSQDDRGVRKILPAIPSGSSTEILIPIGIDGNYTPAKYTFSENKVPGATFTVKIINYLNRNLAVTPPSYYLDYYWCVSTTGFDEENDEHGEANDNFEVTQQYTYTEGLLVDKGIVPGVTEASMLPEYQRTLKMYSWLPVGGGSGIDVADNIITFTPNGHLEGEYTAGVVEEDLPYTELPYLYSLKSGGWDEIGTWGTTPDGCPDGPYCEDGHYKFIPDGNPVIIQDNHTVTVEHKGTRSYTLEFAGLNSTLNLAETYGNDFGRVYGVGKIQMESTPERPFMFPSGDFDNFLKDPRSVVIFCSKKRDGDLSKSPGTSSQPLQNVIISGSYKTKVMASDAWVINGSLTLEEGSTLDNTTYNTPIRVGGDWIEEAGAKYLAGKSTVEFNGDSTQRILISNDNASFYKLTINNNGAAGSDSVIIGLNKKDGFKSFGITNLLNLIDGYLIVDTTLHAPTLASSATVSVKEEASFVDGPIGKEMSVGGSFTFPVGRNGRYAATKLSDVSVGGVWMVDYVDSLLVETGEDDMPIKLVSNEYWRMFASKAGATANIGLRYDSQTLPTINKSDSRQLSKLTIVDHVGKNWNRIDNNRAGTVFTTATPQEAKGYDNVYSIGYVGTTARFDENGGLVHKICDNGGEVRIPVLLTGVPDFNVTYKVTYDGVEVKRERVRFSENGDLVVSAAAIGGYRSTSMPYVVELVSVTDGSGDGIIATRKDGGVSVVDVIEIYVFYNELPEINGDDEVGNGDTRLYSVVPFAGVTPPYNDITYSWDYEGEDVSFDPNNDRETNITFEAEGETTITAEVTYRYSDGTECVNNRNMNINVLSLPVPHILDKDEVRLPDEINACTEREYTFHTSAVTGHDYEWTITNGVIVSGRYERYCTIKWEEGKENGTLTVKESLRSNASINNTHTISVVLYPEPKRSNVTVDDISTDVCYGTGISINVSATTGYQFKILNSNGSDYCNWQSSSYPITTTGITSAETYYITIKNNGCEIEPSERLWYEITVNKNPEIEITMPTALYIGYPAKISWSKVGGANAPTPSAYTFDYGTVSITDDNAGSLVAGENIELPVATSLTNLTGKLKVSESEHNCYTDYDINKEVSQEYLWKGVDSDWNTKTNWWSGNVPTAEKSVHINADGKVGVFPNINTAANAEVETLTIESDGEVTIGSGTLTVAGDLSNAGTFNGANGKVKFTAGSHAVSGTNTFGDIDVVSGATVTFGGESSVKGNIDNDGIIAGTITLNGSSAQTIGGGNFEDVTVNSSGVTIDNSINIGGKLTLTKGIISVDGGQVLVFTNGAKAVVGGSANSYVDGTMWKYGKTPFVFPTGNNGRLAKIGITPGTDATDATYYSASYALVAGKAPLTEGLPTGLARVSQAETWHLDCPDKKSTKITLYWTDADASGITPGEESDLVVAHYIESEGKWKSEAAKFEGGNSITTTSTVTSYSPFTFGTKSTDPAINPLPVTFVAFTGRQEGNTIVLDWATASENDNNYFEIERSTDGVNYVTIGYVDGAGNSSSLLGYRFTDNAPEQGQLYYRLSQVDFDGEKEYADKVVAVLYTGAEIENLTIVPNPTDGLFKVIASGSMAGGRIELLSQAGLVVRIVDIDSFDATIDISDLPSGIYVLRFITDTKVLQQKVVKY